MTQLQLKLLREFVLQMQLREVSARLGYSHATVHRFERDHQVPQEYTAKFKRSFDLTDEDMEAVRKAAELIESVRVRKTRNN